MKLPILAIALAASLNAHAENWAQWRGPAFNGTSPETNLPASWSSADGIKWSTRLPGISGATPAIWEDSIFVSSPDANKNLLLICIDRKDGKVRWQKQVGVGNMEKGRGNMASPSPVTDGKAVYALYGSGDLAAFDFNGNTLWQRNLGADYGRFSINWIYGSSPLLFEGKLYVQVLQRSPAPPDYPGLAGATGDRESYLLALDPATGKTLWKQLRPSEAKLESQESYASPVPHVGPDGKTQLLIVGGDCITGHDPTTGAELWRGYGINRKGGEWMRVVVSPVSAEGLAIACGPKKEPMIAFRTDLKGDITQKESRGALTKRGLRMFAPLFLQWQTLCPGWRLPDAHLPGSKNRRKKMAGQPWRPYGDPQFANRGGWQNLYYQRKRNGLCLRCRRGIQAAGHHPDGGWRRHPLFHCHLQRPAFHSHDRGVALRGAFGRFEGM